MDQCKVWVFPAAPRNLSQRAVGTVILAWSWVILWEQSSFELTKTDLTSASQASYLIFCAFIFLRRPH